MASKTSIKHLAHWYDLQLKHRNPIKTKILTSFSLYSIADITCQLIEKQPNWDKLRTLRQGLVGGLLINPLGQMWLAYASPLITLTKYKKLEPLAKGIPQFIFCGPINTISFLGATEYLKRFSYQDARENVEQKFIRLFKIGFCFHPIFNSVVF